MGQSLAELVKTAFLEVHDGHSTDDVVTDSDLNAIFLNKCQSLCPGVTAYEANWKLLKLRKASSLGEGHDAPGPLGPENARVLFLAARLLQHRC